MSELRDEIKEVVQEVVDSIPTPEFPTSIEVSNFPEIPAPVVNVAPTEVKIPPIKVPKPEVNVSVKPTPVTVNVEKPDLSEIAKGLSDLAKQFSSFAEKEYPQFDYAEMERIAKENKNEYKGGAIGPSKKYLMDKSGKAVNPSMSGEVSTGNSTTTPLASGATYTGTWEQNNHPDVLVMCKTDNTGTLYFDFSSDGTNLDSTFPVNGFKVASGVPEVHKAVKGSRYFRIRLVNDSGAQSYLRIITSFGSFGVLSAPVNQSLANGSDATLVHALDAETDYMIGAYGTDRFTVTKFGQNPDIDTATVPEDIWNAGGVYTGFPTSDIETVTVTSGSGATDSGLTLYIQGKDGSYNIQTETITLNGSGVGVTANTYRRVDRAYVVTPASGQTTNNGDLTATHTTTTGNVFFKILAGTGQTNLCLYTIPAGYTGYLKSYRASMADTTSNQAQMVFWTRENGKAVRLQRAFSVSTAYPFDVRLYSGVSFPEKTDIALRCTSVVNNNGVIQASFGLLLIKN